MILILATSTIDATWFASTVLGLGAQEMSQECKAVVRMSQLPTRCHQIPTYATPQFFERMSTDGPAGSPQEAREVIAARGLQTAVRLRGGTIVRPYDVPEALDRESIERWLSEE